MPASRTQSGPNIEQKIFFITGCGAGIGRHLATRVLERGGFLLATDVNLAALKKVAGAENWPTQRVLLRKLDVRKSADWKSATTALLKKWGRLDVMINNAGVLMPGFIHEVSDKDIENHFDVNTRGVTLGSRAAARIMTEQRTGHIINIASLAGVAPITGLTLYSASKFAVRGLTLAMAEDLRPFDVKVSVICPDVVRTQMYEMQKNYEQAALSFLGPKVLSVNDIEEAIFEKALGKGKREVLIPLSRGILARIGASLPGLSGALTGALRKKGLKKQKAEQN